MGTGSFKLEGGLLLIRTIKEEKALPHRFESQQYANRVLSD